MCTRDHVESSDRFEFSGIGGSRRVLSATLRQAPIRSETSLSSTRRLDALRPFGYTGDSSHRGEMTERLKVHAWKACVGETLPRVRIPLSPPTNLFYRSNLTDSPFAVSKMSPRSRRESSN